MMSECSSSRPDSGISDQQDVDYGQMEEFHNLEGLVQDLSYLPDMPELCDVVFLVGEQKLPLFGVKSVLAIRSRVFYKMLYGHRSQGLKHILPAQNHFNGTSSVGRRLQKLFASESTLRRSLRRSQTPPPQIPAYAQDKTAIVVNEFEADVFKQLLEFIHTGSVTFHPNTILGLMNAADHFLLEDLRKACLEFANCCISVDTVCSLLGSAERYIHYKSTKIFVQKLLDFIVAHGDEVLCLEDFVELPQHVVELILSRDHLNASELAKYRAAERWSRHVVHSQAGCSVGVLMQRFIRYIAFEYIPTAVLMQQVRPLRIVPDHVLVTALAYQADPSSVSQLQLHPSPTSARRWTAVAQTGGISRSKSVSGPYCCDSSGYCESIFVDDEDQMHLATIVRVNSDRRTSSPELNKSVSSSEISSCNQSV